MTCTNINPLRIVEHTKGGHRVFKVGERLSLTHEDDACDALSEIARYMVDLVDDFLCAERTCEAVETGCAEDAPHGTARLRRNADGEFVSRGHADGFDRGPIRELQQVFSRSVTGDLLDDFLRHTEGEALRQLVTKGFGDVGHLIKRTNVLRKDPFVNLLCAEGWLIEICKHRLDVVK